MLADLMNEFYSSELPRGSQTLPLILQVCFEAYLSFHRAAKGAIENESLAGLSPA